MLYISQNFLKTSIVIHCKNGYDATGSHEMDLYLDLDLKEANVSQIRNKPATRRGKGAPRGTHFSFWV